MSNLITEEQFKASFPKDLSKGVPKEVLDDINAMIAKGQEGEFFKEDLMSHTNILQEGKFSLQQYVNAVKYVNYRNMNNTCRRSYELTFPQKITDWLAAGVDEKTISSYVAAFNKTKLVIKMYAVTLAPFHLLNQAYRQEALIKEVKLLRGAKSEMVQHLAASKVLEILAPPEDSKVELDLKVKDNAAMEDLTEAMAGLAKAQKEMLEKGGSLKDVAESTIIEHVADDEDDNVEEGIFTDI